MRRKVLLKNAMDRVIWLAERSLAWDQDGLSDRQITDGMITSVLQSELALKRVRERYRIADVSERDIWGKCVEESTKSKRVQ